MWDTSEYYFLTEFYSVIMLLLIILGLVIIISKWCFGPCDDTSLQPFSYGDTNGPFTWSKNLKLDENVSLQSPISLLTENTKIIPAFCQPLMFSNEYHMVPQEMQIINDGYSVIIIAAWPGNLRPRVSGGPLTDEYKFLQIRFRWGPNDYEGTEHMIDLKKFAMEIQVTFVKQTCNCTSVVSAIGKGCIVVVAYLLEASPIDNPYLEPIISSLKYIQPHCAKTLIRRPPPLSLIAPNFQTHFFYYNGSLTYPPCSEGVKWIVLAETLTISSKQVERFRRLKGPKGFILSNIRPLQRTNTRDVFLYT